MRTDSVKKYVIPNIPYLFIGWACLKLGTAYRLAPGVDLPHKLMGLGQTIGPAFADFAPGLDPLDWLIGIVGAVGFRLLIYAKSKKAKKYRRDEEYGSARWGGPKDFPGGTAPGTPAAPGRRHLWTKCPEVGACGKGGKLNMKRWKSLTAALCAVVLLCGFSVPAKAAMSDLLGGAKLPKMDALKKQRRELAEKKKALYAEYRKAQADMREAVAVKGNIDCLLGHTDERNKAQER